jgi:hypothetical protein
VFGKDAGEDPDNETFPRPTGGAQGIQRDFGGRFYDVEWNGCVMIIRTVYFPSNQLSIDNTHWTLPDNWREGFDENIRAEELPISERRSMGYLY